MRMSRGSWNSDKTAAIIVFLIGVYFTGSLVFQSNVVNLSISYVIGFIIQAILTKLQSPLWSGGRMTWLCGVALGVDVFCNFGGIWPYIANIDGTSSWMAIGEALGASQNLPGIAKGVLTLGLSVAVAGGTETLWKEGNRAK